jgi:hypothetical protein
MMKILVISESLGEPNHKRGIFHFTRELIRSLAAEGHELTLLVETTRRYRRLWKRQRRTGLFPADSRLIELLALYRFLDETDMGDARRATPLLRLVHAPDTDVHVMGIWSMFPAGDRNFAIARQADREQDRRFRICSNRSPSSGTVSKLFS